MSGNKRTWNDKIKLALNELESKINEENVGKTRKRKAETSKSRHQKQRTPKREYQADEEEKTEDFRQDIIMRAVLSVAFLLTTAALIRGIIRVLPGSVTVSNSVNGRELPIYCVETEKKQVALSFDAAWGNCR